MADQEVESSVTRKERYHALWEHFRKYIFYFAVGGLFLLLTNVFGLAIPRRIGQAIQEMRDANAGSNLDVLAAILIDHAQAIILLAIGAGIARIFSRIFIFNAGRKIEFDIRNQLYDKLTTLTPAYFSSIATGDLTSRVTNDVNFVRVLFAISFLHIINTTVAYTIALQKMLVLDVELTIYCLAPYPIFLLFIRVLIKALFQQTKIVQSQLSDVSSKVQENLTGVSVIKTYVLQDRERSLFGDLNEGYLKKNMKLVTIRGGLQSVMALLSGVGTLIVLVAGAMKLEAGVITLGEFVEFNGYVVALAFPTSAMGWVFSVWNRGNAAHERIMEVLETEPAVVEADEPKRLPARGSASGEVKFEHVSFAYDDHAALDDVSLEIPAGSTVAIVGKTGSGKTTLVKLLARLYDPQEGTIRVDGVPLDELALRETRSEMGFVTQDPFLFSMTIAQNIRFGLDALEYDETLDRDAPQGSLTDDRVIDQEERIRQALTIAGLASDIDGFPDGLETLVGERGITLSGGQKQRVTIARALLVDPRLLVLDDALSAVDTQTESLILDHLQTVMADRTSILVTHRFNALDRVDKVFVLDEGRVVEAGTHAELIKNDGVYAEMWARQQLEEELANE